LGSKRDLWPVRSGQAGELERSSDIDADRYLSKDAWHFGEYQSVTAAVGDFFHLTLNRTNLS
jgi:hypothetical protein